jgi:hypothetical protein
VKNWKDGDIIADELFWHSGFMSAEQIQTFLNSKGKNCKKNGSILCLKDYKENTRSTKKDKYCLKSLPDTKNSSAASIIANVANACQISEQVILATLQKENGSVNGITPQTRWYKTAMGYACPDTASCDSKYFGFFNQVYSAARQLNRYRVDGNYGKRPNTTVKISYNPKSSCGTKSVLLANWATAALYIYTPYVPNSAALSAGYGSGNSCSAYGNRNFYLYYNDWFGSSRLLPILGKLKMSGSVRYANTVVAKDTIALTGVTKTYQWYLSGKPIKGATKSKYKPKYIDRKKTLKVKTTASMQGYRTTSFTSPGIKIKTGKFYTKWYFKEKYPYKKNMKLSAKLGNIPSKTSIVYKWYHKTSKGKSIVIGRKRAVIISKNYKNIKLKVYLNRKGFSNSSSTSPNIKL